VAAEPTGRNAGSGLISEANMQPGSQEREQQNHADKLAERNLVVLLGELEDSEIDKGDGRQIGGRAEGPVDAVERVDRERPAAAETAH